MYGLPYALKAQARTYLTDRRYLAAVVITISALLFLFYSDIVKWLFIQFFASHKTATLYHTIFYYTLIVLIPVLALVIAGSSISSMIDRGETRYYVSKVSKGSFLLSRFLTYSIFISALVVAVMLYLTAYMAVKMQRTEILTGIAVILFLTVYSMTFISLYMLISLVFRQFIAVSFIFLAASYIFRDSLFSVFHYVPTQISMSILLQDSLYLLVFPIVFIAAAMIIFRVREV